jgi:D-tyrosyl-tRNA(Tyr) deacylase
MRVVLQRVTKAKCTVNDRVTGEIGTGYMALVGFTFGDNEETLAKMAKKIANLRVFTDAEGKMNLNIGAVGGAVLSIPQFTLYADTSGGNRPSFTASLNPVEAEKLYHRFNAVLAGYGLKVETGVFGAHMDIELLNSGPVTIILEF